MIQPNIGYTAYQRYNDIGSIQSTSHANFYNAKIQFQARKYQKTNNDFPFKKAQLKTTNTIIEFLINTLIYRFIVDFYSVVWIKKMGASK